MNSILRSLTLALILVALSTPVWAQKKNASKTKQPTTEKQVFVGVIEYVTKDQMDKKPPRPKRATPSLDGTDKSAAVLVAEPSNDKYGLRLIANADFVMVNQNTARAFTFGDDNMLRAGFLEDDHFVEALFPIQKFYQENQPVFELISAAVVNKDYASAAKLMESVYKRTPETKQIGNYNCVKYICLFGKDESRELWVCEDFVLAHYMTPFWGMIYPVFEADFALPFDGLVPFRVFASNVLLNSEMVEKFGPAGFPVNEIDPSFVIEAFISQPHRYNRK